MPAEAVSSRRQDRADRGAGLARAPLPLQERCSGASGLPASTIWVFSSNKPFSSSGPSGCELSCTIATALHHFSGVLPFALAPALCWRASGMPDGLGMRQGTFSGLSLGQTSEMPLPMIQATGVSGPIRVLLDLASHGNGT